MVIPGGEIHATGFSRKEVLQLLSINQASMQSNVTETNQLTQINCEVSFFTTKLKKRL